MNKFWTWVVLTALAFLISILFGVTPYILYTLEAFSTDAQSRIEAVSYVGGMFGPASTIFSGLALIAIIISIQQQRDALSLQHEELELNRKELRSSAEAQQEIAEQQKKAISLEIIMPFMNEITSMDMRDAILKLIKFYRGYDNFDEHYDLLLKSYNSDSLDEQSLQEFSSIDDARRRFVGLFHKMQRLAATKVVEEEVIKVVLGPDHCWVLLTIVEPLDAKIRKNYSRNSFNFARSLYSESIIEEHGAYKS